MLDRNAIEIANEWLAVWSGPQSVAISPDGDSVLDWELPGDYPDLCWATILHILAVMDLDVSNRLFGVLAAGPLEDLLSNHGEAFIDRVEAQTRSNPSFALLLGGVWRSAIDEEVWARMQAVAQGAW